jgi:hypothetical protein
MCPILLARYAAFAGKVERHPCHSSKRASLPGFTGVSAAKFWDQPFSASATRDLHVVTIKAHRPHFQPLLRVLKATAVVEPEVLFVKR